MKACVGGGSGGGCFWTQITCFFCPCTLMCLVGLGWMGFFFFSWTKEGCYSSLLNQSLHRSDLASILAGLRRVLEVFYVPATFEECYSDFLLQPWPPSYSTVWATSTSSKYLGNLSWTEKNQLWVLCLSFSVNPPTREQVQVKNPYLDSMEEDILYHFSLSTKTHNLPEMFGDIKVSE